MPANWKKLYVLSDQKNLIIYGHFKDEEKAWRAFSFCVRDEKGMEKLASRARQDYSPEL